MSAQPNRPPLWEAVMTRAGGQCERTSTSRGKTTRCEHLTHLVVAPKDPAVPEHAAWRVPVADLAAWCSPCLSDARRRAAASKRRRGARVIPGQCDLLAEIPGEMSDPSGNVGTVTPQSEGVGSSE